MTSRSQRRKNYDERYKTVLHRPFPEFQIYDEEYTPMVDSSILGNLIVYSGFMEPNGHHNISRRDAVFSDGYIETLESSNRAEGIDYKATDGKCRSWYSGVVRNVNSGTGYGKQVTVETDKEVTVEGGVYRAWLTFSHLSSYNVKFGDRVHSGEVLGYQGSSGLQRKKGNSPHISMRSYIKTEHGEIEVSPNLIEFGQQPVSFRDYEYYLGDSSEEELMNSYLRVMHILREQGIAERRDNLERFLEELKLDQGYVWYRGRDYHYDDLDQLGYDWEHSQHEDSDLHHSENRELHHYHDQDVDPQYTREAYHRDVDYHQHQDYDSNQNNNNNQNTNVNVTNVSSDSDSYSSHHEQRSSVGRYWNNNRGGIIRIIGTIIIVIIVINFVIYILPMSLLGL